MPKFTPKKMAKLKPTQSLEGKRFITRLVGCHMHRCAEWRELSIKADMPKCPRHEVPMRWLGSVYEDRTTGERFRYKH